MGEQQQEPRLPSLICLENNPHLFDEALDDLPIIDADAALEALRETRRRESGTVVIPNEPDSDEEEAEQASNLEMIRALDDMDAKYDYIRERYRGACKHVDTYNRRMVQRSRFHFGPYDPPSAVSAKEERLFQASVQFIEQAEALQVWPSDCRPVEDGLTWDDYWHDIAEEDEPASRQRECEAIPRRVRRTRKQRLLRLKTIL